MHKQTSLSPLNTAPSTHTHLCKIQAPKPHWVHLFQLSLWLRTFCNWFKSLNFIHHHYYFMKRLLHLLHLLCAHPGCCSHKHHWLTVFRRWCVFIIEPLWLLYFSHFPSSVNPPWVQSKTFFFCFSSWRHKATVLSTAGAFYQWMERASGVISITITVSTMNKCLFI